MKVWNSFIVIFVLALALASCSGEQEQSADESQPARGVAQYDAATFFQTTSYSLARSSSGAFSPDGTELLISSDRSGVFNAYALPVSGGEPVALTTSTTSAVYALSWFPADRRILYTADNGGNELNHIYVRGENGEVTDLTPGEALKASFVGWTGDRSGFWIVTNERDPKFFDLYRYDTASYAREQIYRNDQGYAVSAVSRDGRWLGLGKPRTSADSDVYVVDLSSKEKTAELVTAHEGNVAHGVYGFTADSRSLIYATNEYGEFDQAWSYDLESGRKGVLAVADWDIVDVSFSASGRYRVVSTNHDATSVISITDTVSGEPVSLPTLPPGDMLSLRFSSDEGKLAFLLRSSASPSNVNVVDLAERTHMQLTSALNPAIDAGDLVTAEVVRYESYDGLMIPGILYKPHQASSATPAPALVWVHGGPGGQSRTGYSATIQHLVNHGYAVLAANNRGSGGYGKTFNHMDDKRHGEVDLDDIVEARAYLESLPWVDREKIGIIGGSYGGYMVGAALAFRPDVFDVGINIFGVMNWVRTLESIPPWWASFREALYDEMGDPAVDAERHRRISPLFHAGNIKKPLLVVQGANDPRVLQVESDEIVAAVRANNVPVEYVVFPDEGHGFRKRANRIAASEAYVGFLDNYLRGGAGSVTESGPD